MYLQIFDQEEKGAFSVIIMYIILNVNPQYLYIDSLQERILLIKLLNYYKIWRILLLF